MPNYNFAKIGDKYFSVGSGSNIQETSLQDIYGNMGDISPATYQRFGVQQGDWKGLLNLPSGDFSGGGILEVNPGDLSLGEFTEGKHVALYKGSPFSLAGSRASIPNQATAQALGLSNFGQLPAGGQETGGAVGWIGALHKALELEQLH